MTMRHAEPRRLHDKLYVRKVLNASNQGRWVVFDYFQPTFHDTWLEAIAHVRRILEGVAKCSTG